MRLFWVAWGFAVGLIVLSVGGTAWVFSVSDGWSDAPRIGSRALSLAGSIAAFVGAFRLAMLATARLRFVLAQNLAALILLELDELRRTTEERAAALAGRDVLQLHSSDALPIPRFLGDRNEIRKLLGPATEHTLEQVLESLQSYNQAAVGVGSAAAGNADDGRHAALRLWHEIGVVQERLKQAAREVGTFCLAN